MSETDVRAAATSAEPVAWELRHSDGGMWQHPFYVEARARQVAANLGPDWSVRPLYASPAPQVAALTEERDSWHAAAVQSAAVHLRTIAERDQLLAKVASLSAALEEAKRNAVRRVGCARHDTTVEGCQYCRRVAKARLAALPAGDAAR